MNVRRFVLQRVPVGSIKSNKVQPKGRIETQRLKTLLKSIQDSGVIEPFPVYQEGHNYVILNGHRRKRCAEILGLDELDVLVLQDVTPKDKAVLFFMQCVTKPLQGNERIQAWALAPNSQRTNVLAAMPVAQAQQIIDLIDILGEEETIQMALEGASLASVSKCVRAVRSWITGFGHQEYVENAQIARWLISHQMLRRVDTIARDATRRSTEAIVRAIANNKPYNGPKR